MKEEVSRWLTFAEEDLKTAKLTFNEKIYNQTCFHAQQCVEKLLKAYIIQDDKTPPKSHRLADLLSQIDNSFFNSIKMDILPLDRFYIPTR